MHTNIFVGTVLFLLGLIISRSVQKKGRPTPKQKVTKWSRRPIHSPAEPVFLCYASGTVAFVIKKGEDKILLYTDFSCCTGCKLQLSKWKEMLVLTDSLLPGKVTYLFFFDNFHIAEIRHLLKQADLKYPVCINITHELNHLNNFPHNRQFQTFLLDKHNQLMAVGKPMLKQSVRQLYIQKMTGKKENASQRQLTLALAEPRFIDLSLLKEKETRTTRVKYLIMENDPWFYWKLSLIADARNPYSVAPPCYLEKAQVWEPYYPNDKGTFSKMILLYANISGPILLTIRGKVTSL